MDSAEFPEANATFQEPVHMDPAHCMRIRGYVGRIAGGPLDGQTIVVTAWKPTVDDLAQLLDGKPLFVSFIGGLPPHYPSTDFHAATNPK